MKFLASWFLYHFFTKNILSNLENSTSYPILFSEAPELSALSFNAEEFLEGDFAQSNCVLRKGDKPIVISWLFNGLPLAQSDVIQIAKMGSRTSILTIDPLGGVHQGNYSCVASNPAGKMTVYTELRVNGTFFSISDFLLSSSAFNCWLLLFSVVGFLCFQLLASFLFICWLLSWYCRCSRWVFWYRLSANYSSVTSARCCHGENFADGYRTPEVKY